MWLMAFIAWLALAAWLSNKVFIKIFPGVWTNLALAVFLPIFFLGTTANIFTAWFKLTDQSIIFCLAAILIALAFFAYHFSRQLDIEMAAPEPPAENRFPQWLWLVFAGLIIAGAYFTLTAGTAKHLDSPWQILPIWYLLCAGLAAMIIFYAIFYGEKHKNVLMGIVIFSLLVHGYLLVYQNGFGADRFRHLASEARIMSGQEYQPTLLAADIWKIKLGPISLPQALVDRSKLSYGAQWSLEVIAAKATGWPIFQINRFLLPLLWAVLLPLLIYLGARLIDPEPRRRFALLAGQLASSLYLFQYYGSQGLPASYGLLGLAFIMILILSYLKRGSRPLLWLIIVLLVLSYFNYSLGFILALIIFTLAWTIKNKPRLIWLAGIISVVLLMMIDYTSAKTFSLAWNTPLIAIIGSNLIYFNPFSYNFGEWHMLIDLAFVVAVVVLAVWSARFAIKTENMPWKLVCWLFGAAFGAYFLANSLFSGDHLLARRLTLFACLPLVFIIARLVGGFSARMKPVLAASILGAAFMLVYFSGPVLDVSISADDLARAQELLPAVEAAPNQCVKEPLPVILALEYLSAKNFQETINNENCSR